MDTAHDVELFKLPVREQDFSGLVASYRAFTMLDLSHFDMVISSKYPAWMVRHPNHVVYMAHVFRGLYEDYLDSYHLNDAGADILTQTVATRYLSPMFTRHALHK